MLKTTFGNSFILKRYSQFNVERRRNTSRRALIVISAPQLAIWNWWERTHHTGARGSLSQSGSTKGPRFFTAGPGHKKPRPRSIFLGRKNLRPRPALVRPIFYQKISKFYHFLIFLCVKTKISAAGAKFLKMCFNAENVHKLTILFKNETCH